MALPLPKLDLRSFGQLLESAKKVIGTYGTWTDRSVHDPGMILLEAFAHLTEVLIYRVNRLPERAHIELLRLLGIRLQPATVAKTRLRFSLEAPSNRQVRIPRGTRVSTKGAEPERIFTTVREAVLEPGKKSVEVLGCHCLMETESLGTGTGQGGQRFTAPGGSFADAGDDPDLAVLVGVELGTGQPVDRSRTRAEQGLTYHLWKEVGAFSPHVGTESPFSIDRATGTVQFAPALRTGSQNGGLIDQPETIAAVPANGRDIRIWGPRGGGPDGNLPENSLVQLVDPVADVDLSVNNPQAAVGGAEAESLANALLRGPMTFRTVERAISTADYEWLAVQANQAVKRAKALARCDLWCFAKPGTVEVVLVPNQLPGAGGTPVDLDHVRQEVLKDLEERRALGTSCEVSWARYKPVAVKARVVVHDDEDPSSAKQRLEERLSQAINPLSESAKAPTWKFGNELTVSAVYDIVLTDPGVHRLEQLRLCVDAAPDREIEILERDPFQESTWYAGGPCLYRSLNDGNSWEPWLQSDEGRIACICSHPLIEGLLAAATRYDIEKDGKTITRSRVFISRDCGEHWELLQETSQVRDIAWLPQADEPHILIATDDGLLRGPLVPGNPDLTVPVKIKTQIHQTDQTIYALASFLDNEGDINVVAAMSQNRGIYLSKQGGKKNTFKHIGPSNSLNIRLLLVQQEGTQIWLWAGTGASGGVGQGCWRRDFRGEVSTSDDWEEFTDGWVGGACYGLAFCGDRLLAATGDRGVLSLDPTAQDPAWVADETFKSGLPQKGSLELYHTVRTVAARSGTAALAMTGGPKGVYRSSDCGERFVTCCLREFNDQVSLPKTWLIRSGDHDLEVVYDHGQK